MPQYQNEYEGFGNALMNIGSLYYSQEEKKKEEARLRKEKEDERKYLAEQAEVEWNRRKPIEEYKQALALAKQASTEAERNRPRYFNSGSERITQVRVPDGKGGYEFVEGSEPIKEQPRTQRELSPYVEVGGNLVDTRTMEAVYKGESKAKAAKPLYTPSDLTRAETAYNNMLVKQASEVMPQKREAMQVGIDKQAEVVKRISDYINTPLIEQESAGANTPAPTSGDATKKEAAALSAYAAGNTAVGDAYVAGANEGKANVNIVPQRETPAWKAAYIAGLAAAKAEGFTGDEAVAEAEAYADIAAE